MKHSKIWSIYFPGKSRSTAKYQPSDIHEKPKFTSPMHSPFPLPKHDADFGFGPSSVPLETLPHVQRAQSLFENIPKRPEITFDSAEQSPLAVGTSTRDEKLAQKTKASTSPLPDQEKVADHLSKAKSGTVSRKNGRHFPVYDELDNRLSRIERMNVHPQIVRYRSALSPLNLIREWKQCMRHSFQNTQSIYTRADILSKLSDFSNQEIGEVLHMMTLRHEAGTPFYTIKRQNRAITQHYDLTIPDIGMHQSHFSFLAGIEEFLVSKETKRLVEDSKFLATVLRVFAHVRCDDTTSDYERFAQTYSPTYNLQAKVFMRTGTYLDWHAPCGEDLFRVAQSIVCGQIDHLQLPQLVEILGAVVALRQWADGAFLSAVKDRTERILESFNDIQIDISPGPNYAQRYEKYRAIKESISEASQIYLLLSLGGVWDESLAQTVIDHAMRFVRFSATGVSATSKSGSCTHYPLDDRLQHVRRKVAVFRPPPEVFLAIASAYPLQGDTFIELWKSIPDAYRVVSDYKYLHDMLLRETRRDVRQRIIEETVQSLDVLDDILLRALSFFGKDFPARAVQGFTAQERVETLKRTANSVRFLDATCFYPQCDKQFITHEMDLQATGGKVPTLCYSSLRAIQDRTQNFAKLKPNTQWALNIVKEEVQKGTIQLVLPSDEIALCRESFGNDLMMPIFAVRYMTETMPLVEPVVVTRHKSHHKQDAFPIFTESGRSSPFQGGQDEIRSTFFNEPLLTKRFIKFEKPKSVPYCETLHHYDDWVDEKLRGILHNERMQYKRSHNLDYKEIVTERPGFHSFLHDVRKAGYAPQDGT